jgi:hypothetical protein
MSHEGTGVLKSIPTPLVEKQQKATLRVRGLAFIHPPSFAKERDRVTNQDEDNIN